MQVLLVGIGAKYIHSNLALNYLAKFADNEKHYDIQIANFTINQQSDEIYGAILLHQPAVLCFSCYIWNITLIETLVPALALALPETKIFLGGPEVSFDPQAVLARLPQVAGIMCGEGELIFQALLAALAAGSDYGHVPGLTYRDAVGVIKDNPPPPPLDLARLPFPYDDDLADTANRIIYYESSRGCPYACAYCLSSVEKGVRLAPLDKVCHELQQFLDAFVPQVKFVDRTFNCNRNHTMGIWRYLADHDNGVTNFHFELTADLLDEAQIQFLSQVRPGLFQFEIGIQSTNPDTISAVNRWVNFARIVPLVRQIKQAGNIHQHLDLIAGLPLEDYDSFANSFNDVYALAPEQLQLGFLKVLKGSPIAAAKDTYGIIHWPSAPYEVIATDALTAQELLRLKDVEDVLERYYNSGKFLQTLALLVPLVASPFVFYEGLGDYFRQKGHFATSLSRIGLCEALQGYGATLPGYDGAAFARHLAYDLYRHELPRKVPAFLRGAYAATTEEVKAFYHDEGFLATYLANYPEMSPKAISRITHLAHFDQPVGKDVTSWVFFDYQQRDLLGNAQAHAIVEWSNQ